MKKHHIKTHVQVKEEFIRKGISISGWAKQHGFKRELVFSILSGKRLCRFGKSHKIAVMLGMKDGEIV